jgi:hypothetical protein
MGKRSKLPRFAIAAVLTMALASLGALPASAGKVRERRERQQERIAQGVLDESVVPGEARNLRREQKRIRRSERRMRAENGKLTRRERKKLDRMQEATAWGEFVATAGACQDLQGGSLRSWQRSGGGRRGW